MSKRHSQQSDLEVALDGHLRDEPGKKMPLFLAAFAAQIGAIICGCVIGWTSPSIPNLKKNETGIEITESDESWISSMAPLAAAVGPFVAGFAAEKFGRKKSLLYASVPFLASWICLAAGENVGLILFGRFLGGFCVGWIFTVLPMYCGEIAEDSVRGALGSLMQTSICVGLLFDYCIGPYVPYQWLSISAAILPVVFVASLIWVPESPYYLIGRGDTDSAKKALAWFRGKSQDGVAHEMKTMQAEVERAQTQSGSLKDLFATRGTTKAMIISLGLVAFQQFSGINVVLFNAQQIFEKAAGGAGKNVTIVVDEDQQSDGGAMTPELSTIITGIVMLAASIVTPFVVDRLGRRVLLLISAIGMAVAQGVLGLCFFLDEKQITDTSSFSFLPLVAVLVFLIVYGFGFGPLPWAVMGEIFPPNIKSLASTLTASFCWLLGFIVTRFFNDLVKSIGNCYTFWLFAACCVVAVPFISILLPETKGKPLAEIQTILNR